MKKGMHKIDNCYGEDSSKENKCTQNASMKEVKRNNQDEKTNKEKLNENDTGKESANA